MGNDSSFCSTAGLTPVAFSFQPCGKDVASCTTGTCCRATCADFCSEGQSGRVGNGEPTTQCYFPDDMNHGGFSNSALNPGVTPINCRNAGDECGLTTAACAKSLCCELYSPEYPKNPGLDST